MRTGVTVILPHEGNPFREKLVAAVETFNGFGKPIGFEQIRELGTLESPVGLTNTLSVDRVADGITTWALEQNPDSGPLHMVVGSLYELRGRTKEAMARYEDAIRLDPDLAVARNNLAYLIAQEGGDLDRALDLAQETKAALPDNPNTADTLGWVLYKKGLASAAIGYLKEAMGGLPAEDPQLALVRHHLALAYEANGEGEQARQTLDDAVRDLDAIYRGEDGERRPEPPWTAEIRSMHQRLSAGG